RFLFIIDVSSAMKKHQADELRVVHEILADSGAGQMHAGDTIGLWTFNQEVFSDLPLQNVTPGNLQEIDDRTLNFLKHQRYAKSSHLDRALADMRQVV